MKKMKIEKTIVLDHEVDTIEDLSCYEKIQTTALSNGLECSGFIEIAGKGRIQDRVYPIHELIDLSIFAPFSKLSDTEQFGVTLSEYDVKVKNDELQCVFYFEVSGIIENQVNDDLQTMEAIENEEASLEDLLDDSEVVHEKLRYAITYTNDTYASIASRYGVDEKTIRALNQNRILSGRMLILLP